MADTPVAPKQFSPEWLRKEGNTQVLPKPDGSTKGNVTSDADSNRGPPRDRGPPVSNPGRGRGGGGGVPPGERWGGHPDPSRQPQGGNTRRQPRDGQRDFYEDEGRGRRPGFVQPGSAPQNGRGVAPSGLVGGFPHGPPYPPYSVLRNDPPRGGMVTRGHRGPEVQHVLKEDFPTLGPQRNMQHPNYYGHGMMIPPKQVPMASHMKVPQERWHSCLAAPKGVETQQVNPLLSNGSSGAAALAAVGKEPVPRRMSEAVKQAPPRGIAEKPRLVDKQQAKLVPIVNLKNRVAPNQAPNQAFYVGPPAPRPAAPDVHKLPAQGGNPAMLKLPGNPRLCNQGLAHQTQVDRSEPHLLIASGGVKAAPAALGTAAGAGSIAVAPMTGPATANGDAGPAAPKAPDTPGSGKRGNDRHVFFDSLKKKDKSGPAGTGESIVSQSSTDSVSLPTSPMAQDPALATSDLQDMEPPSPVTMNVQYEMPPAPSSPVEKSKLTTWVTGLKLPNTPSSAPPLPPGAAVVGAGPDSMFAGLGEQRESRTAAQDAAGRVGKDAPKAEVASTFHKRRQGPVILPNEEDLVDFGFTVEPSSSTITHRGPSTDMSHSIHALPFVPKPKQPAAPVSTPMSAPPVSAPPPQQYPNNAHFNVNHYRGYSPAHQSPVSVPAPMQNNLHPVPYPHAASPHPAYPSPPTHMYHSGVHSYTAASSAAPYY